MRGFSVSFPMPRAPVERSGQCPVLFQAARLEGFHESAGRAIEAHDAWPASPLGSSPDTRCERPAPCRAAVRRALEALEGR